MRNLKFQNWKNTFTGNEGSVLNFARSYKRFGVNLNEDGNIVYREWAPQAKEISLVSILSLFFIYYSKIPQFGDFNGWNRDSHKCKKDDYGVWTLVIPKDSDGTLPMKHDTRFKCCVTKNNGERVDRIPAWSKYTK